MSICGRHEASTKGSSTRTTRDDFCRIFTQDMKSLYLLSFLLTADHKRAEHCFAAGMEDCVAGNPVFKEWANAWSRRAIIKNAIRVVSPLSHPTNPAGPALNVWGSMLAACVRIAWAASPGNPLALWNKAARIVPLAFRAPFTLIFSVAPPFNS